MANHLSRRKLMQAAAAAASTLIIARVSHAQQPVLSEEDSTAVAMGYKADHRTVDTAAWPKKAGPGGVLSSSAPTAPFTSPSMMSTACALSFPASASTRPAGATAGWPEASVQQPSPLRRFAARRRHGPGRGIGRRLRRGAGSGRRFQQQLVPAPAHVVQMME